MIYTGIGSRTAPLPILSLMTDISYIFALNGWTLRSGGAQGADKAFENGYDAYFKNSQVKPPAEGKEIYLPWRGFNNNQSQYFTVGDKAIELARKFHPIGDRLNGVALKFHARNGYQILGPQLDHPTDVVICWTKFGEPIGGTGQALRLAKHFDIPIFNLWRAEYKQTSALQYYNMIVEKVTKFNS